MGNYSKEDYKYECPNGCKNSSGGPIAAAIRGWKKHMTHAHGGWTEDQLALIVGAGAAASPEKGKDQFLSEMNEASEPEDKPEKKPDGSSAQKLESKPTKPIPEEIVYIPLRSKRLRKFVSGLVGKFSVNVELDDEDKGMIDEAFDQLEELFPVVFAVPKKQLVIESRLAALAVPIGTLALVYIKHSFSWEWFKGLFKKDDEPPMDQAA